MASNKTNDLPEEAYDPDWLKGTSADTTSKKASSSAQFSDPIYKQLSKANGQVNKMSMNDLIATLKELDLDSRGQKEVLKKRLKNHYKERGLADPEQKQAKEFKCKYDYVCVIDYEATCEKNNKDGGSDDEYQHEIIEFPVVLVNMKTLEIEDCFDSFCKPVLNPTLSPFCTTLTGIQQNQVDSADTFPVVLKRVEDWLTAHELGDKYKFAVAADGPWDMQKFLNLQCYLSKVNYPRWARKWIDVRKLFSNWNGVRRCNIEKMLAYCGLEFIGQQHCGLDDARNIARILIGLAKDGCHIKVNANLKNCLTKIEKKPNDKSESD